MRVIVTDTIIVTSLSPVALRPKQVLDLDEAEAMALIESHPTFFRLAPGVADGDPTLAVEKSAAGKRRKAKA